MFILFSMSGRTLKTSFWRENIEIEKRVFGGIFLKYIVFEIILEIFFEINFSQRETFDKHIVHKFTWVMITTCNKHKIKLLWSNHND